MKSIASIFMMMMSLSLCADETWEIRMSLDVPRVYCNSTSLGYRKYNHQTIIGRFKVSCVTDDEPSIEWVSLVNKTHKVGGENVTYETETDNVLWHGIGSNKTCKFNTRSVLMSIFAEPSYAIGVEPTDDNSLIVTLAGRGNASRISGKVSGQIGCACAEYGHISPTRIWCTSTVVDTAAVFGTFTARRLNK